MRRASLLVIAASLVGSTPIGCSLLTSLDGLSGGADATDAMTAVEAPANADHSVPDTGRTDSSMSSADAGEAGEAGPIDPCVGAVFCDQFERDDVQGTWNTFYTDNGGTAAIDGTTFTSATRSLALHVPVSPTTGDPHAQLGSANYDNVAHVRVSFSMKVGAPDRVMSLMRLQFTQSASAAQVFDVFMLSGKLVAHEQAPSGPGGYYEYAVTGFVPDVWQRWTMEVDATGSSAVGVVTINATEVIRTTLNDPFKRSSFSVLLGAFYAPTGPAHDIFFDDFAITILP